MKNKEFRTLMAIVTLTGTLLTGLTAWAAPAYAADTVNTTTTTETSSSTSVSNAKPYKDETVYATIDGDGTVKAVTVSDQLKNISDVKNVTDKSDLQNIENVKGNETFTSKNGTLTWNTADADICYQGTTTKALPVAVKVTYTLDGKQMPASELVGKSGHLVIRYTYENNSAEKAEEKTPFLMATGLMLDSAVFKNVTVTNGKLLSDGEKEIAIGLGLPSVSEMLGTDELDIPDYFEVEADVTKYEAVEGMTVATNSLFNDLDTESFDNLSDLQDSMNQLQSASNQLVDGSGKLREGLDTLLSSSGTLTDGINQLATGSSSLAAGTQTLKDGADELSGGLNTASSKVSNELLPGVQALDNGVAQMQGSLTSNLPTLANGVSALDNGIGQVADGTHALKTGIDQVTAGTHALYNGLTQAGAGISSVHSGVQALAQKTPELETGATGVSDEAAALATALKGLSNSTANIATSAAADSRDEIQTLQNLLDSGAITDKTTADTINAVITTLASEQDTRDAATNAPSELNAALEGLSAKADILAAGAKTVADGTAAVNAQFQSGSSDTPTLADGVTQLYGAFHSENGIIASTKKLEDALSTGTETTPSIQAAITRLDAALNIGDPDKNVSSLRNGASQLNTAVNGKDGLTAQVSGGVSQLKAGTSQLLAGVDGENGLAAGLNLLNAGAGKLASGSGDLNIGANTLANGIGTLQTGSGALIDGVKQLDDGAVQLNDGMIQFNEEGIQKLVNVFSGDIEGLLDKANAMLDTSRSYKNFSGIADDMDGEVKFVFVTE